MVATAHITSKHGSVSRIYCVMLIFTLSNTSLLAPMQGCHPVGIVIGAAIYAGLTVVNL